MNSEKPAAPSPNFRQRRIFISCVSHEFRAYRDALSTSLAQPGVEIRRQEDFVNSGLTTLEKLDIYILTCDAVIHLVGDSAGAYPTRPQVENLLAKYPDFSSKLGIEELVATPGLSYTQWEAWLAIYHGKPLGIYRADDRAKREIGFAADPDQMQRQFLHWQSLCDLGRDRKDFLTPQDLSIEVLRAMPLMVPGFSENLRSGAFRDRNLLFAVLALQDEILTREEFVGICALWGADNNRSISDLMREEGLLGDEDLRLIEARMERKLKHRGGDLRRSLAESLGGDLRQTLADSLDPAALGCLPVPVLSHPELKGSSDTWRYRLTRTHGEGGLGVVSVAEDGTLDRSVAVKQLRQERLLDPMAIERFVREARITGNLQHPNVVPVYELGLTPGDQTPFYAMRFVGHRTLLDAIRQHHQDKESPESVLNLRFRELLQAYVSVCNATAFAHSQGIIHRDLKPENIMIGDFGEVILLDWGLAKRTGEAELPALPEIQPESRNSATADSTLAGTALGTPAYMAPEQASGRSDLHGIPTDIWGLGVILYEILTGDVPFKGASTDDLLAAIQEREFIPFREVKAGVPAPLAAICEEALQKIPARRYASVKDLTDDVQHWLADEPVSVFPETGVVRFQRTVRKNPGPVSGIAAAVLVSLVGLGSGFYFVGKERDKSIASNNLAAKRYDEKRGALDQMLQTFGDDGLKGQAGSQPIRKLFLEKGLAQYRDLLAEQSDNPNVILRTAETLRELGLVTKELGLVSESNENLDKAIQLCRKAAGDHPNNLAMKSALGDATHEMAQSLFEENKLQDAKPHAEESVKIYRSLLIIEPANIDYKAKLGRSLVRLASLMPTASGKASLQEATLLLRDAASAAPENPAYLVNLARALNNSVAEETWGAPDSLATFQESQSLVERALRIAPTIPLGNSLFTRFSVNVSKSLQASGRLPDALALIERVIVSMRRQAAANPSVISGNIALADLLREKASLFEALRETDESLQTYEEIVRTTESLAFRDPGNPSYAVAVARAIAASANAYSQLNRKDEADAMLGRITKKSDYLFAQHPKSESLLDILLQTHADHGDLLLESRRFDQAIQIYRGGTNLYKAALSSIPRPPESCLSNYTTCARGLIDSIAGKDGFSAAIPIAEDLLLSVPYDAFPTPDLRQQLLLGHSRLANWYADTERTGDAIKLLTKVVTEAKSIAGTESSSNFYIYQHIINSYQPLARWHRQQGQKFSSYSMLRKFFSETLPYQTEISYEDLLAKTAIYNEHNFEVLWRTSESIPRSAKRLSIPVNFNGESRLYNVYLTGSWRSLEDQIRYVEKVHHGVFPADAKDSFARLYKIAKENKVSFVDLSIYAMARPGATLKAELVDEAPVITHDSEDEKIPETRIADLATFKAEFQNAEGADLQRRSLIRQYLEIVEEQIDLANYFAAAGFLEDAIGYLRINSNEKPNSPKDADLLYNVRYLESALFAAQGRLDQAYETALKNLRNGPIPSASEIGYTAPLGSQEFTLGWIRKRQGNPLEAAVWYMRADELGYKNSARNLSRLLLEFPEIASALPTEMKLKIARSGRSYAADLATAATAKRGAKKVFAHDHYLAARSYALSSRLQSVFSDEPKSSLDNSSKEMASLASRSLADAVAGGFNDFAKMKADPDLKALQGVPEFQWPEGP